jgi:hypothetical protein
MHRTPSTAGGCNAEASRRYLLEGRAFDPQRQCLLLVLAGLELGGPGRVVSSCVMSKVLRGLRNLGPGIVRVWSSTMSAMYAQTNGEQIM